ncbi:MAG: PEP-CTERM sorting domain-containing protein [Planctomycetota bacterium]
MKRFGYLLGGVAALMSAWGVASYAQSAFYTFTSGPSGDGFIWDEDDPPFGLNDLSDGETFFAPTDDGFDIVNVENFTGNVTFFDSQYQAAGNSPDIDGDAWWGNPTDTEFSEAGITFINIDDPIETVSFDFAYAAAGFSVDPEIFVAVFDSSDNFSGNSYSLNNQFNAGVVFGGFDGASGSVTIDLFDFPELEDIEGFYVDVTSVASFGATGEFAIDNVSVNGGVGGSEGSNVFPSVNGGSIDVTDSILSVSVLQGVGTQSISVSVTNDGSEDTTFSTQLLPGSQLTSVEQASGNFLFAGDTDFNAAVLSADRSQPSGEYDGDILVINDDDPSDPDDTVTLRVRIFEAPALSGNFSLVNASANQLIELNNAAAPAGGFRASVRVTDTQVDGPFIADGFVIGTDLKPGEVLQSSVDLDRFGLLSDTYTGTFTAGFDMTAFIPFPSGDFETNLNQAAPVDDLTWNLSFTLGNRSSDSESYNAGDDFLRTVGINSSSTAVTLVGGEASGNRNVSLNFALASDPEEADFVSTPFDATITGGTVDPYVLQVTYRESDLGEGVAEEDLRLLVFDALDGVWGEVPSDRTSPFIGSFENFDEINVGTLADNVGAFGVDVANNQAWFVLDDDGRFALGTLLGTASLPGDYNGSGQVEQGDLNLVLNNWGTPRGDWENADGFATLNVDQEELNGVLNNWGDTAASPSFQGSSVPEPAALGLLGLTALGCTRRR